jgi:glycosyltransferase involved in cell wall biosynthesis
MNTNFPKLSVLLTTYRQPEILVLTLRDLANQDYPANSWELVVIDDGSGDSSAETALSFFPEDFTITVKRLPLGGRYAHAILFNEMLRLASVQSHIFVHLEDARVRPSFLREHAKWHNTKDLFLVTGPMCEGSAETFDPSACSRWKLMQMSGVVSQAYRCCFQAVFAKSMSYSRELLDRLKESGDKNPFDQSMTGWGYHEIDFAVRAERVGAVCIYDVGCGVYHPIHNLRDELEYRGIDRARVQSEGQAQNIDYLCKKHGLARLPDWKVGVPIEPPIGL